MVYSLRYTKSLQNKFTVIYIPDCFKLITKLTKIFGEWQNKRIISFQNYNNCFNRPWHIFDEIWSIFWGRRIILQLHSKENNWDIIGNLSSIGYDIIAFTGSGLLKTLIFPTGMKIASTNIEICKIFVS